MIKLGVPLTLLALFAWVAAASLLYIAVTKVLHGGKPVPC